MSWIPKYLEDELILDSKEEIDALVYGGHISPHDIIYWGRKEALKRARKSLEESKNVDTRL